LLIGKSILNQSNLKKEFHITINKALFLPKINHKQTKIKQTQKQLENEFRDDKERDTNTSLVVKIRVVGHIQGA